MHQARPKKTPIQYEISEFIEVWGLVNYAATTEICKRKSIPLQAVTGPEGSRRLRLSDF
jgi:hypothetical protein